MESVSKYFKKENDFLFKEGREEGQEKLKIEMVTRQIVQLGFSDEQIANTLGFSIDFIQSVRKKIQA